MKGTLFAIKRYALHDGPNIRTTLFLKGCPLSCWWCHNPEGLNAQTQMVWSAERCIGCLACVDVCPQQALRSSGLGILRDQQQCRSCGECARTCPALAHEATGWQAEVEEVMTELVKDIPFFDQSGGGVTFSGGEPLVQHRFLLALLKAAGKLGLHRAVDTSGYATRSVIAAVAEHTDLFLYDLKHMDNRQHRHYTGVDNRPILDNLRFLLDQGHHVQVRFPLIPGINDDSANIKATGDFLRSLPRVRTVDVLPFHPSARAKYAKLERPDQVRHIAAPATDHVNGIVQQLERFDLTVRIGG